MTTGRSNSVKYSPEDLTRLLGLGWYLDTSLFMDFIDRNVKTAFDTAEEHDGRTLLHLGPGTKAGFYTPLVVNGRRFQFALTHNVTHLQFIQVQYKTRYFYSELTKAEIFRALRKSHSERPTTEIQDWWAAFCALMRDYSRAEAGIEIGEELSELALNFPIRKNAQDYLHLIISRRQGLAFITSDKLGDQISELKRQYYPEIHYWPDVRDAVPLEEILKNIPNVKPGK
jgi:hypothetical protein